MLREKKQELNLLANQFRQRLIEQLHAIQTGHPGGSLSATEIITTLYFDTMNVSAENVDCIKRDRFILSKGHAAPMLYLALAEKGYFPQEEIKSLRQMDSILQGHPCCVSTPGVELCTGPLGLGLSAGIGMAIGEKLSGRDTTVYVLLGDGEIQEGIVWEGAMSAAKFKVDNCITILDNNGVQLDGTTEEIMPMGDISAKWRAFGWNVIEIDGHDVEAIANALEEAKNTKGKPTLINAKTVKGKGISFMEGQSMWHGKPISDDEYKQAMSELRGESHGK
ncbi:MAG TPA: transketolase [Epulopiscium sp.]|nr:transketolase [Candidatus Epulonipiscium sp.]